MTFLEPNTVRLKLKAMDYESESKGVLRKDSSRLSRAL